MPFILFDKAHAYTIYFGAYVSGACEKKQFCDSQ